MSITKTDDGFEIECDGAGCVETFTVESPNHDWQDFMKTRREKGWVSIKEVDDQWVQLCPHCKDEYE